MMNRVVSQLLIYLCLMGFGITSYGNVRAENKTVESAKALFSQLKLQSNASDFSRIAKQTGTIIDQARSTKFEVSNLKILRNLMEEMRKHTRQQVKNTESGIRENEAALERLYRSQAWDDLNFAQAAFAYWRAWIDLELARGIRNENAKHRALLPALKGFRVASMQLFRPDLIYGGWLGIGYVEMERGHLDRARDIFNRLEDVLSLAPDSTIREAVSLELRLLNVRTGNVNASHVNREINDNEAKMLRIEAFILLDEARKSGHQPLGVAQRLKALINAGHMDQTLLQEMMNYSQEITAINLGAWSDLATAEFRLQHKDYRRATQKFETFFKKVVVPRGVNVDNYRYRWAVAAYKAKHYQTATNILEKLVRRRHLDKNLKKTASKLLFAATSARESGEPSSANRSSLRRAAQRYLKIFPTDRDSDAARLVIAQTSPDANVALNSLAQIRTNSKYRTDVDRASYQIITAEFQKKIVQGKIESAMNLAIDGLKTFNKLTKKEQANAGNKALMIQMRALVDPNPVEVLLALETFGNQQNSNRDIRRSLLWSQLQLYKRLGESEKLTGLIGSLSASSIPDWQMVFLYPWIAQIEDANLRLELARLAHPSAKTDPDMDRRFRRLIIESLIVTENSAAAYEDARDFSQTYSNSGYAWRLLGRTAELTDRPFEADKAWSVITKSALPTTDMWWEGMLNRARIRAASTRPEQACPLVEELKVRSQYLPAFYKVEYKTLLETSSC